MSANLPDHANLSLGRHSLQISYSASNPVTKLQLLRDGEVITEYPISEPSKAGSFVKDDMNFDTSWSGSHVITVRAIDQYYYIAEATYHITFVEDQT